MLSWHDRATSTPMSEWSAMDEHTEGTCDPTTCEYHAEERHWQTLPAYLAGQEDQLPPCENCGRLVLDATRCSVNNFGGGGVDDDTHGPAVSLRSPATLAPGSGARVSRAGATAYREEPVQIRPATNLLTDPCLCAACGERPALDGVEVFGAEVCGDCATEIAYDLRKEDALWGRHCSEACGYCGACS